MSLVFGLATGLLIAIGLYHVLGRSVFRIAFGIYIILNALNLLILSVAGPPFRNAPFSHLEPPYADPLGQAMVLTAIIIGFGLSTFLLFVTARLVREKGSRDASVMREWRN